jgi:3-oxoacyl-[acyl-carrier-protein] synthase-3
LSVISSILTASNFKKAILLAGDTISKLCSINDKSTYPLFGDAGTATAIEYKEGASLAFHVAADGKGTDAIKVSDGGFRNMANNDSFIFHNFGEGICRNNMQLALNGMDVFSFGISKAPESVNNLLANFDIDKDTIDYFIFHQANKFMNEKIRKKLKLPEEKVPYSLKFFGNTSSATIPLTLVANIRNEIRESTKKIVACGFGVGLSWGSVYFVADHIVCPDLIEI